MNTLLLDTLVAAALAFGVWLHSRSKYRSRNPRGLPLPPGPSGIPVVGNLLDMPKSEEWRGVTEWGKRYGPLTYVEIFGKPMLYVNSYDVAIELLEKRSANYSDRPRFPMMGELMGWDWLLMCQRYGDRFRKHRWFMHRFLQPSAVKDYLPLQTRETHRLIDNLLNSPGKYAHHLRRTAGAVIMMVAYGHEVAPEGDYFISLVDKATGTLSQASVSGTYLVDYLHILTYLPAWFPGAHFKKQAREWRSLARAMRDTPFAMTKAQIAGGTARPCMMSRLLESSADSDGHCQDEDIIAGVTAVSYAGGSDTVVSSMASFILALVLFPNVQRRGQEEIDRVVGPTRLPTFADRPALPYIEAIVNEVHRWNPVIPLGVPHSSVADDEYAGYFIPAGTQVIVNQWGMLHDAGEYPDPSEFSPERWLGEGGKRVPRDPRKAAFGWGRRACPGRHLAENAIFMAVATVLATLHVDKAVDEGGRPITPDGMNQPGFSSHPEHFQCSISPRSAEAVALIRHSIANNQ